MDDNATFSYRENQYPFIFQVVSNWGDLYLLPGVRLGFGYKGWREEELGQDLTGIDGEFLPQTPIFCRLCQSTTFSSGGPVLINLQRSVPKLLEFQLLSASPAISILP